ncbi:glycoside hydrolase family 15 protein [Pontibacter sp. 172403-2]|uniref:glycoside hydrolase family 15 protein n=1 Tax=Pontibacter rufus TaxID=2791028 RepID=UPI0018B012F3|nr:glycoside hydrolase family 15 protein [Pontibacter sp. 172403-2]MBF9253707.1 glycoside hydrolase family 15 protein [Pontibacter sp. 172403-2]
MKEYLPIADYGLIGNLHTTALVSMTGSIDYLPFTRFDSPTIFAALLDKDKGGYWQLCPAHKETRQKQLYLPDTGVLLTRFFTPDGMAELTDFMPLKEHECNCTVVRMIRVIKGQIKFNMTLKPRFNYARDAHELTREGDALLFTGKGPHKVQFRLITNQEVNIQDGDVNAEWELQQGDKAYFVIETVPQQEGSFMGEDLLDFVEKSFDKTVIFWRSWVEQSTYQGRWHETVIRSAITLKLMTSREYGSTIAAATFGLPEHIGGGRNWDYRFTWIRDAAFTMYAFLRLGFRGEAQHFLAWIMERCRELHEADELQLMYTVDGQTQLQEEILGHLEGYKCSRPVRIGNAASKQFQLDIYGELIDTIYLFNKHGGPITYEFWKYVTLFVNYVVRHWQDDDHGIWEVRAGKKDFLYSKIMAWVAIDRAINIARDRSFPAPMEEWMNTRNDIYKEVYENYWNEEKQSFVQYKGADVLDSSVLIMTLVRMFSPDEPRFKATMEAIEKSLVTDSLVYRYNIGAGAVDGLAGQEGTFSICSFWYIENLSKAGKVEKARLQFEKMMGYANHLGLFSEQIGLQGELLGNFPQAFTHLALISAAEQLSKDLGHTKHPVVDLS